MVLRCVLCLVVTWLLLVVPPVAFSSDSANNLGQAVQSKYGSKGGIQQNIANPMTGGTAMTTVDGSASFEAQLSCPAAAKFVEIAIQPMASGDLQLIVAQDTNFDGTIDATFRPSVVVSGVCSNGVIACTPGTWNGCRSLAWSVDGRGELSFVEVGSSELGGCYCVNNHCGNGLAVQNRSVILNNLGGGAVGALQHFDARYAVSQVTSTDISITYSGQASSSCVAATSGVSGRVNPQSYYQNPASLTSDADIASPIIHDDPLFTLVQSAGENEGNAFDIRPCSIVRSLTIVTENQLLENETGERWWGTDHNASASMSLDEENSTATTKRMQLYWHGDWSGYAGPLQVWDFFVGDHGGGTVMAWKIEPIWSVVADGKSRSSVGFTTVNYSAWGAKGIQTFWIRWNVEVSVRKDVRREAVNNNCTALENDSSCILLAETVDGVSTYLDGVATGLVPLPSIREFTTELGTYNQARNFWRKERTYRCTSGGGHNFGAAIERTAHIENNTTLTGSSMNYRSKELINGVWNPSSGSAVLHHQSAPECTAACKTRKPVMNPQASGRISASDYQRNTQTYEFFYRPCMSGSCPVAAGESIDIDCQCIEEFAEAASVMSALDGVAKDIICSDGVKK